MRVVKLTARMKKMLPDTLLLKLGAVHKGYGLPTHVYMSKEDYKELTAVVRRQFKKEYPGSQRTEYSTQMTMLNLGPNTSLQDGIRPGYILVDDDAIVAERARKDL